jgi:hypothetical protein
VVRFCERWADFEAKDFFARRARRRRPMGDGEVGFEAQNAFVCGLDESDEWELG